MKVCMEVSREKHHPRDNYKSVRIKTLANAVRLLYATVDRAVKSLMWVSYSGVRSNAMSTLVTFVEAVSLHLKY